MCLGRVDCVCAEAEAEFVVEDTKLDKMLAVVAEAAFPAVVNAYHDAMQANDIDPEAILCDVDFDLYLYVYGRGSWVIDRPDYLLDHRDIVATVLVGPYDSVDTLRMELEASTF